MRVIGVSLALLPIVVVLLVSSILRGLTLPFRALLALRRGAAKA
ncbi:hypothetical protein [Methylobacterium nodulans]|uniref:Uncharacterized protein n=1 Tax=Methylobacterium nodulans (strain LMG 21967 / CNCM I-2342 / ORS 2060) TaxID=460265 RepID=B8ICH9_METNO|nr:hypothetical protein [Methylobacterium nodulans]ACL55567.1 conserved hypothetical protein [Methylobacterium nodulans ORS 2060]